MPSSTKTKKALGRTCAPGCLAMYDVDETQVEIALTCTPFPMVRWARKPSEPDPTDSTDEGLLPVTPYCFVFRRATEYGSSFGCMPFLPLFCAAIVACSAWGEGRATWIFRGTPTASPVLEHDGPAHLVTSGRSAYGVGLRDHLCLFRMPFGVVEREGCTVVPSLGRSTSLDMPPTESSRGVSPHDIAESRQRPGRLFVSGKRVCTRLLGFLWGTRLLFAVGHACERAGGPPRREEVHVRRP